MNVLEHTQNAFAVLHNVWASLRPGGILIFQDMAFDREPRLGGNEGELALHPLHIKLKVLNLLLAHFKPLFRNDDGTVECSVRGDKFVYFIGVKKTVAEEAAAAAAKGKGSKVKVGP